MSSISFAKVDTGPTGAAAGGSGNGGVTFASVASQTGTASGAANTGKTWYNPGKNGGGGDSSGWSVNSDSKLDYFTKPYFDNRTLSWPSWRYVFIMWILWAIFLFFLATRTALRRYRAKQLNRGSKDPILNSMGGFSRAIGSCTIFLKKIYLFPIHYETSEETVTSSSKHQHVASLNEDDRVISRSGSPGTESQEKKNANKGTTSSSHQGVWKTVLLGFTPRLTSVGQWVSLAIGTLIVLLLCTVGADYLAPSRCMFSAGPCKIRSSGPPTKRDNPNGWNPMMSHLLTQPNTDTNVDWASSSRIGLITYGMLPIIITLGVKQWPVNIWAMPWIANYHIDKTIFFHRWFGRLAWVLSTAHMALYVKRLVHDIDPWGKPVLHDAFAFWHFIFGWIAYAALTVICLLGFRPFRERYYEIFYSSHVVLVILFLVGCGLHHPADMWWCWVALIIWAVEKGYRMLLAYYINGYTLKQAWSWVICKEGKGSKPVMMNVKTSSRSSEYQDSDKRVKTHHRSGDGGVSDESQLLAGDKNYAQKPPMTFRNGDAPYDQGGDANSNTGGAPMYASVDLSAATQSQEHYLRNPHDIPYGHALVQLLPGRAMRLVIHTKHPIAAAPGQYISLNIPGVRPWEQHPYTIMSRGGVLATHEKPPSKLHYACSPESCESEFIVLLVRKTKGKYAFANAFYNHMAEKRSASHVTMSNEDSLPPLFIRANVTWPIGSSVGLELSSYDAHVHICGGTGITFSASIIESTVGDIIAKASTSYQVPRKIVLIWIIKDQSHLVWAATQLRECLTKAPRGLLEIQLYASDDSKSSLSHPRQYSQFPASESEGQLQNLSESLPDLGNSSEKFTSIELGPTDHKKSLGKMGLVPGYPYHQPYVNDSDFLHPQSQETLSSHHMQYNYDNASNDDMNRYWNQGAHRAGLYAYHDRGHGPQRNESSRQPHHSHYIDPAETPNMTALAEFDTDDNDTSGPDRRLAKSLRREGRLRRALSQNKHKKYASEKSPMGSLEGLDTKEGRSPKMYSASILDYYADTDVDADTDVEDKETRLHNMRNKMGGQGIQGNQKSGVKYQTPPLTEIRDHWDVEERDLVDAGYLSEYFIPHTSSIDFVSLIRRVSDHTGNGNANGANRGTLVTVCGPASLNVRIERAVSTLLDPKAAFYSKPLGKIDFYSENF